ncbi:MAG: histidine kinase N-terminal 7TM domain-containing protein [Bacteroidota bacterium]
MSFPYAYTPQIWPPAFTALVLIALAFYSWHHRNVPGTLPFAFALLFAALWMAGISLEIAAVDASAKIFWAEFQAVWLLPTATTVICFLLEYAWPGHWLTRRNLVLLSIPCLLAFGLILTNDLHHLVWQGFVLDGEVIPLNGPGNWIFLVYAYGLGLLNLVVLAWLFIRSPQHRVPAALILVGQIGVRVAYGLGIVGVIHTNLPIEVIAFWFQIPMYVIALFGFRFLNPIPLARQTVIEQLRDGMIVVDPQGQVASLNPAAEQILQTPAKMAKGRAVGDLLPVNVEEMLEAPEETEIEFTLRVEQGDSRPPLRYCTLEISKLKDWRGMEAGSLLLLRDVTSRKQAEAALNETRETQRLIYEKSFDGISIYEELPDQDKRVLVDCNKRYCQMADRSKAELLDIQDTRVIQEAENLSEESDWAAVMAEQAFSGVFSWIRPDGKQNIIEYKAAPIRVGERFFTIGVDRDVTESRQTQAQILEQQRALSMLQEREQLARELHDGLGQVLGYTGLRMEATRKLIADGKLAIADEQLVQLEDIVADAHADVREYILNLRTAPTGERPFFATLQHYLDGFLKNYGIRADLSIGSGVEEAIFTSEAQVQLLRIIQEAFSNARKHAQASCMHLSFEMRNALVCIRIQDNGKGFEPTQAAREGHFGLHIMRERAEQLGGHLEVNSAPGEGTCVEVEIPVNGHSAVNR